MNKAIYVTPVEKDHPNSNIIFWFVFKLLIIKLLQKKSTIHYNHSISKKITNY